MLEHTSFVINSYTTHQVYNDMELLIGEIKKITNIGIKDVGGVSVAVGIGKIQFTIKNQDEIRKNITLDNMIYLPDCPEHIIFITR